MFSSIATLLLVFLGSASATSKYPGYGGYGGYGSGVGYGPGYGGYGRGYGVGRGFGGKGDDKCNKCRKKYSLLQCTKHRYCGGFGYHRHLSSVENTRALAQDHGECMADSYNMFLVMQGAHMAGLATPANENSACPNLVFHSHVPVEGDMVKSVMTLQEEGVSTIDGDEKLHLGVQSLVSIISAFDAADVNKKNEKAYDAVTNNCVVLLRNMADPLDIAVDKRMISFVSKRLLAESGSHIVDLMKDSPALSAIIGTGGRFLKGVGAEEIVSKVIELYV